MKELIQKFRDYLDYVEEHYENVQKAWKLIQEKCRDKGFRFLYDDFVWDTIDEEIKGHDLSKLSAAEFTQYRQFFYPCKGETKNKELFLEAVTHHKEKNVHHWENWVTKAENNPYADAYLVMNVVDWVAMGMKFGDTARDFYEKNKETIKLPEWAVELMYKIFDCIY